MQQSEPKLAPLIGIPLFPPEVPAMLLGRVFEPFVQQSPVAVMARGILERLLDPQAIDRLFERTAQRQYNGGIAISCYTAEKQAYNSARMPPLCVATFDVVL